MEPKRAKTIHDFGSTHTYSQYIDFCLGLDRRRLCSRYPALVKLIFFQYIGGLLRFNPFAKYLKKDWRDCEFHLDEGLEGMWSRFWEETRRLLNSKFKSKSFNLEKIKTLRY